MPPNAMCCDPSFPKPTTYPAQCCSAAIFQPQRPWTSIKTYATLLLMGSSPDVPALCYAIGEHTVS